MRLYTELSDVDEPGYGLDYLQECQPLEQIIGIRWLCARIDGALDAIEAVGATGHPKAIAIGAIAETHRRRVRDSWEWAIAFGMMVAREAGEQWARHLQSNEGAHPSRAEQIVDTAITLSREGYSPEHIMLGIETVARMHAHHDREAAMIVDTAKALDLVLPGHRIDDHWVTSYGADTYEANDLANHMRDQADSLLVQPDAHRSLVHWCEMRLHGDALALGAQLGTPTGATPIRRANGALRYDDTRQSIETMLGVAPTPLRRPQCANGIGALEPMDVPEDRAVAKAVGVYNAMLQRAQEAFPKRGA